MNKALSLLLVLLGTSLGAFALTGSRDSDKISLETVSPVLESVTPASEQSLSVTFSEPMLSPGVTTPGMYAVSGPGAGTLGINPATADSSGPYTLSWADGEMLGGESLTVTAAGVQDLAGNVIRPAQASASCAGLGVAPVFSNFHALPAEAATGDHVTVSFTASEILDGAPVVTINGNEAAWVSGSKAVDFVYRYEVQFSDLVGAALISVSGLDPAGNLGLANDNTALAIVEREPEVPLTPWPLGLAFLAAGVFVLVFRPKRARAGLLMALSAGLAASAAFAQAPAISNVLVSQSPNGTNGTKVDVYYDLVAPGPPCSILLSLSKDGGADGFTHPITHYSGDIANMATSIGRHIVWNIRADYPEESIPEARIRVTATDALVQHTLAYMAGPYGAISGLTPQVVGHGGSGSEVTAVPGAACTFRQWSDGVLTPSRTDSIVTADLSVTASFAPPMPAVTALAINGGAASTTLLAVTLDNTCTGYPAEYLASESPGFTGAVWQPYAAAPSFSLSSGAGMRTLYFKVRNETAESNVMTESIVLEPTLLPVTAGTFSMGRPYAWPAYSGSEPTGDELPVHAVDLSAYQIGRCEVTNKEYCDVLNWAMAQGYLMDAAGAAWAGTGNVYAGGSGARYLLVGINEYWGNVDFVDGSFSPRVRIGMPYQTDYPTDSHPVLMVSWFGAAAFCNWLNEILGLAPSYDMNTPEWPLAPAPRTGYRLPTEAEWERAAAWDGAKHWVYGFTSDTLASKDRINYYDENPNYINPLGLQLWPDTTPAAWFNGTNVSPNGNIPTLNSVSPAGCYDMSGNVSEWCYDRYEYTYYNGGAMTDPIGPATGAVRSFRGGSWATRFWSCRCVDRGGLAPDTLHFGLGFRLARSQP